MPKPSVGGRSDSKVCSPSCDGLYQVLAHGLAQNDLISPLVLVCATSGYVCGLCYTPRMALPGSGLQAFNGTIAVLVQQLSPRGRCTVWNQYPYKLHVFMLQTCNTASSPLGTPSVCLVMSFPYYVMLDSLNGWLLIKPRPQPATKNPSNVKICNRTAPLVFYTHQGVIYPGNMEIEPLGLAKHTDSREPLDLCSQLPLYLFYRVCLTWHNNR